MGASSSSSAEKELREERRKLEEQKTRLDQMAIQQHWTEQRLREEQQQKEAAEKWQREQQQKEAAEKWRREQQQKDAYKALQRQLDELKIQQCLQMEQQQQVSVPPPVTSWASVIDKRETVPLQQRVMPAVEAKRPSDTPPPTSAPLPMRPAQPVNLQAFLDANQVCPKPTVLPKAKPQQNNVPDTFVTRMNASIVHCMEWSIVDYVTEENSLTKTTAVNVMKLLDDDNTISFIARYRSGMTQGMEEDELRNVKKSYERARLIKQRAVSIIKGVDKQGKWTPELHALVHESKSLEDLNYIYSIFKVSKAKDVGLGKIAEAVVQGKAIVPLSYLVQPATEVLRSEEQVTDGIVYIVADTMNKDIRVFNIIKKLRSKYTIGIDTNFADVEINEPITIKQEFDRQKYAWYNNFTSTEKLLTPADISKIKSGEAEKVLSVKINISPPFVQAFNDRCLQLYMDAVKASPQHKKLISAAIDYMWNRWTGPSIRKRVREEMNEKAEIATMEIIVQYAKRLFLAPPVRGKVVIGIFSLSQGVCKLAVVSEQGNYLESETIYPNNTDNAGAQYNAEVKLVRMVKKYKCTTLAGGNGSACKENKKFITDLIKKKAFGALEVSYTIVDEAGLEFYSCSRAASSEFPRIDDTVIAAVSIARRLQDPMAELVKIEPKYLVAEMHQQDVPENRLTATLNDVIVDAVSSVGVDVNTASAALLKRVAGLDEGKAKSIIEWRKSSGPFTNRNDLIRVKGIGSKTFEQCAGFIRIMPETAVGSDGQRASQHSLNYLDQTLIHPQYYDVAKAFLEDAKCNVNHLGSSDFIFVVKIFAGQGSATLAKKFGTTKDVIELVVNGLTMERAPIVKAKNDANVNTTTPPAGDSNSKTSFDDLTLETVLTGVVSNIKPFGAFVKVGLGRQGLIHKRYMNGMTLSVGQRVETIVNTIDKERRIFGLRLLKCI